MKIKLLARALKGLLIVFILLLNSACISNTVYSGDGKYEIKRNWPFPSYILSFKPMRLSATTKRVYKVGNLPKQESVVGISLDTSGGLSCNDLKATKIKDIKLRIILLREEIDRVRHD